MAFKVGDKVICVKGFSDFDNAGFKHEFPKPKKDGIYVISQIDQKHRGTFLAFTGFKGFYIEHKFRKLDYDFVEDVISNLKEEPVEA